MVALNNEHLLRVSPLFILPPDSEPYRNFFTLTKKATQNWVRAATKTETLHDVTVGTNC